MSTAKVQRFTAFTLDPNGGNPAGVWIGDELPDPKTMRCIAAEVGYSETAFIAPATGRDRTVRYYSPEAEVPFCGHATIASGVVLANAEGDGKFRFETVVGEVPVDVGTVDGNRRASLTSVTPKHESASKGLVTDVMLTLGWDMGSLDPTIPPAKAFAGAWHLVLVAGSLERLNQLEYDFERLKIIMLRNNLTTIQLIWREDERNFHSRNPFPVGGVVEDPATGAAAAAFSGYLRDAGLIDAPAQIRIRQGDAMGRPSVLDVEIGPSGGIRVSGTAVRIE